MHKYSTGFCIVYSFFIFTFTLQQVFIMGFSEIPAKASSNFQVPRSLIHDSIVNVITNNDDLVKLQKQWIMTPRDVELLSDANWEELSLSNDGEKALKKLVTKPKFDRVDQMDNEKQLLGTILDTLQKLVQILKVKVNEEPKEVTPVTPEPVWYTLDIVEAKRFLSRNRDKEFTPKDHDMLGRFILKAISQSDVAAMKYFFALWNGKLPQRFFYDIVATNALLSSDRQTIMFVKENLLSGNTKIFERIFRDILHFKAPMKNVFQLGPILKNDLFFTKKTFNMYLDLVSKTRDIC